MTRKHWSFIFLGNEPFVLQIGVNRPIDHNGGMSLYNLNLSEEEREFLERWLKENSHTYQAISTDTTEEEKEQKRLQMEKDNNFFHCSLCPTCCWYNLSTVNRCGAMDMPYGIVKKILKNENGIHAKAYSMCPIISKRLE